MTDTIIFDLDGTLLNTLDDLADSTNYSLRKCGFPERSIDEIRSFVGNGVRLLIERAVPENTPEKDTDACFGIFTAHYDKNMENKTRPYDGIIEMLALVKQNGFKTAVVSNKYDSAVKKLVSERFGGFIDAAVGESGTVRKKPAPDGVDYALACLKSERQNAVYVGDSDVDALTARNSRMRFIGVTWGFRDRALLESMGADCVIDRPAQIFAAIGESEK